MVVSGSDNEYDNKMKKMIIDPTQNIGLRER